MGMSVRARATAIATFRFVMVRIMEMLARWVPSTPEMEVKALFGEHIWEAAQAADALGHRAFELRSPLHFTLPAADGYQNVLDTLAGTSGTAERLRGFYDVLLPGLERHFRRYLEATDALLDAPSVRVVEQILQRSTRMRDAYLALLREIPRLAEVEPAWHQEIASAEAAQLELIRVPPPGEAPTPP